MHRRILHKTSMLAVGPYRFIRYSNNLGLVAEVGEKTGTVKNVTSTHLLPCLSAFRQVQIDKLPVDIIKKDVGEH